MNKLYMVLDEEQGCWSWCILHDRELIQASKSFARYADAFADAEKHGFTGVPSFAKAQPRQKLH